MATEATLTVTFTIKAEDKLQARDVKLDLEGDVTNLIANYRGELPSAEWTGSDFQFSS